MLHDLSGSDEPVVVDEIRLGLLFQRDPFESVLDLVIVPTILDKAVGDSKTTLEILNMCRRCGRKGVRGASAGEGDANR